MKKSITIERYRQGELVTSVRQIMQVYPYHGAHFTRYGGEPYPVVGNTIKVKC